MLPSRDNLLQKAKAALAAHDKITFDRSIHQILSSDIECDEAWKMLYRQYGKGKTYPQFKLYFTQKYFPGNISPPQQIPVPVNTPTESTTYSIPMRPLEDDNEPIVEVSVHKSRGNLSSVMAGMIYMPYAGFYAMPIIVVGETFLYFIIESALSSQGGGIVGMIVAPIAFLIILGVVAYVVPFIGMLLYIAIILSLIVTGIVGGVIGLGLGIACGIAYLLTRWASSIVSTLACAMLGGVAGYIAATWANDAIHSYALPGSFWSYLNYGLLILTGVAGGVLFVAVADDTELGSNAQRMAIQDSKNAKSFSPISWYGNVAEYFKWSAEMGEQEQERERVRERNLR